MSKVWLLEQGDYSDYRVVGVFSTEENAERVAQLVNSSNAAYEDTATVREVDLDPGIADLNAGRDIYSIQMELDGEVSSVAKVECFGLYFGDGLRVWKRTKAPAYSGKRISDAIKGCVWAKDEQHAVKITNEFRAQAIAEGRMKHWGET